MWLGHDRVARKLLTHATAGDALLQNAVTGVAVPFRVFVHTALTTAFYVGRTTAAVKAAFAQQILLHRITLSQTDRSPNSSSFLRYPYPRQ